MTDDLRRIIADLPGGIGKAPTTRPGASTLDGDRAERVRRVVADVTRDGGMNSMRRPRPGVAEPEPRPAVRTPKRPKLPARGPAERLARSWLACERLDPAPAQAVLAAIDAQRAAQAIRSDADAELSALRSQLVADAASGATTPRAAAETLIARRSELAVSAEAEQIERDVAATAVRVAAARIVGDDPDQLVATLTAAMRWHTDRIAALHAKLPAEVRSADDAIGDPATAKAWAELHHHADQVRNLWSLADRLRHEELLPDLEPKYHGPAFRYRDHHTAATLSDAGVSERTTAGMRELVAAGCDPHVATAEWVADQWWRDHLTGHRHHSAAALLAQHFPTEPDGPAAA